MARVMYGVWCMMYGANTDTSGQGSGLASVEVYEEEDGGEVNIKKGFFEL